MTAAPAAELVLVQDQDAFSPPERPSGTKVVQVARPPKALERHRYPVLVSFYAGADYYFRAADQLRADCERIGIDYEIEELTLKHHEDWSRICRRKVEFIERKLKQLKRPILWVDVDTRINSIPSFLKDPSWDFAACLRGGSELDPVRLLSFARMWTPTVLVVNDTPMGHALVETMVKEARRHGGEATDDYFLEEAWRKLRSDLVALPIPPKFLDRNGSHPEAAFIYGPSGSVKTFKDSVDQHPNDKLGNLKAKIVSEISAKITDLQMRRNLLRTAWSREITDMDVMLKLAEQAKRVEPELAVEILLRAAGLHPRKYESRRMLVDLLLEQRDLKRARVSRRRSRPPSTTTGAVSAARGSPTSSSRSARPRPASG